jgi:hypothetical protein
VAQLDGRPRTRDRISARGTLVNTRPPQGLCTLLETQVLSACGALSLQLL